MTHKNYNHIKQLSFESIDFVSLLVYIMCESDYKTQSIHFNKDTMTFDDCLEWVCNNHYKIKQVTETNYVWIFHQLSPAYMKRIGYADYRCKFGNDKVCIINGFRTIKSNNLTNRDV